LVRQSEPDVLCLQEIKVRDQDFPLALFNRLGFPYSAVHGQSGYHGVAILSRYPLADVRTHLWAGGRDSRHLRALLPNGIEVHNVYVPAGGRLPDAKRNPKFAYKLRFLAALTRWFRRQRDAGYRSILTGDLNVAPLRDDVWSHEKLVRVVTHTPVEVKALEGLQRTLDWIDAVRYFRPAPEKIYTWWSYRALDWKRVDKGRRLDHIWVTPALREALICASVVKNVRGWKPPSDHAPVLLTLRG
jgi:exodeoxyribonuclease-3